ncbi:FAT1-like protein [Mya arenaria]|uniref:FAT1-like protein n=1 Tax=Mya arenaria TaxID=6604 RepID=A0ABY7F7V4_MYAAR|nr:multiple epidermal growth factor-like domains protein 10 [Mya arenaria]WAR16881.1 FAT1-like protein [Mya arenaria]
MFPIQWCTRCLVFISLLASSCVAVTVVIRGEVVDCSLNCVCCKGEDRCGYHKIFGNNYCFEGCVDTIYGHRCHTPCPDNCYTCTQDRGIPCLSCKATFYDLNNQCSETCSVGCDGGSCSNDGTCSPCVGNFQGNKCDTCKHGFYGLSCDLHCADNCFRGTCSRNGTCPDGCIAGYSGNTCSYPCEPNCATCQQYDKSYCTSCFNEYSGSTCRCPPNCRCEGDVDECTSCVHLYSNPDYKCQCHTKYCNGDKCNICTNITYFVHEGLSSCCPCSSSCKNAICSSQFQCLNGCENGMYGNDCSKKCSDIDRMCLSCSQDTGRCTHCTNGFYPDVYRNCSACKATCIDDKCDGSSGRCIKGCIDGNWGNQCEDSCDILCRTCERMTGECIGCIHPSLYGPYCNLSCSSNCINSECDMVGDCLIGCSEGYTGVGCKYQATASGINVGLIAGVGAIGISIGLVTALITVIILRRRRRGKKHSDAVIEGQRPFETSLSITDGHTIYDELDKKQIGVSQDGQQYEMIQSSTSPVDTKQFGEV